MPYDERKRALRYLMLLNEKGDGTIKTRGCVEGRSHRNTLPKQRQALPHHH